MARSVTWAVGLAMLVGTAGPELKTDPEPMGPLLDVSVATGKDSFCECTAGGSLIALHVDDESREEADTPLKLPEWWNAKDPLPLKKSNCVRCHLTAGRELTLPLRDYARSVHDRALLSCNDCHGGNTKNDAKAHEPEFDFIGTKLSAHMQACTDCHHTETEGFRKGKHYWDLSQSINLKYPVCIDCHGNHDVGRPPAEFALMNVCTDCHKEFDKEMPGAAAVVARNDALWKTLREVHARNAAEVDPTPETFREELKRVRTTTSLLIHRAQPISPEEAQRLNERVDRLRDRLEAWLKEQK